MGRWKHSPAMQEARVVEVLGDAGPRTMTAPPGATAAHDVREPLPDGYKAPRKKRQRRVTRTVDLGAIMRAVCAEVNGRSKL